MSDTFEELPDAPHPSESQSCSGCIFWRRPYKHSTGAAKENFIMLGECHRYPPHQDHGNGFRPTPASEWCGEWQDTKRKLFEFKHVPWPVEAQERYRK